MVDIAKDKAEEQDLSDFVMFEIGNIQDMNFKKKFDAVICMFAVIGYQISNDTLFSTLQTVHRHLRPKGLFICDFWYGPAVLKQRPVERVKLLSKEENRILRIARPEIDTQENVVTVSYHLLRLRDMQLVEETQEVHQMRYLFKPEMEFMLSQAGLRLVHFCPFERPDEKAGEETWNVAAVAQAVQQS
jgi:SAM-dependent methyltransferase